MPFRTARANTSLRLAELQLMLNLLRASDTTVPRPPELATLKGFFIVHLYAYVEFSVKEITQSAVALVNSSNVIHKHLKPCVFTLVSENLFKAATDSKGDKKWQRRYEIAINHDNANTCRINDAAFTGEMSNTRMSTVELAFSMFGISDSPYVDHTIGNLLEEIGVRRNAVAHGRESPSQVGGNYTFRELEERYNKMDAQISYMFSNFEDMASRKLFIKPNCRRYYP